MDKEKIQVYEEFLMKRNQFEFKTKEFSQNREYLRILGMIKNMTTQDEEVKNNLLKFCKNPQIDEELKKNLKTHMLLRKFDLANDNEKKELLQKLNERFFNCNFDFNKPKDLKYREDLDTDSKEEKINTCLTDNIKEKMTLEYQLNVIYDKKQIQDLQKVLIQYLQEIDLSKFDIIDDKEFLKSIILRLKISQIHKVKNYIQFIKKYIQSYPNDDFIQHNIYKKLEFTQILQLIQDDQLKTDIYLLNQYLEKRIKLDDYENKTKDEQISYLEWLKQFIEDNNLQNHYVELLQVIKFQVSYLSTILDKKDYIQKLKNTLIEIQNNETNKQVLKQPQFKLSYLGDTLKQDSEEKMDLMQNKIFDNYDIEYFIDMFSIEKKQQSEIKFKYYSYKLLQGKEQEAAQKFMLKERYLELRDNQILQIKTVQDQYQQNDKVEIELTIKNINKVLIKVYEIDAWTYLQNNLNENFINVDVTGFLAQKEYNLNFDEGPFKKHISIHNLDYIQNKKRGQFIVDVQGSIITSRALIIKGQYQVIQKYDNDRIVNILDENFQVCKGSDTKIWIQNKFLQANEDTGEIEIPSDIVSYNGKIILCHDNFYQLANLNVQNLNTCHFDFACYFNPENIQDNEKLKFILDLRYYQQNILQPLSKIEDFLIAVNTYALDNTDNQITFKDIKPVDNKTIDLEFLAPNELSNIKILISFRANINGEKKTFSQTKNIIFDRRIDKQDILQIFLNQNDKKEYLLRCLGKNGEPLNGIYLDFKFYHKFSSSSLDTKLVSNQNGDIFLGHLDNVSSFRVLQENNQLEEFYLTQNKSLVYQTDMTFLKDEQIKLPIKENSKIELFNVDQYQQNIKQINNFTIQNNWLIISNLNEGTYKLQIDDNIIIIQIKNAQIINDKFGIVRDKDQFYHKNQACNYLQTIIEDTENQKLFKIISDINSNCQVYLSQNNFLNYDNKKVIDQYGQQQNQQIQIQNRNRQQNFSQDILQSQNQCINDQDLSRELIYCQQRKNQSKMIGNTLHNPSLLTLKQKQFGANQQMEGFDNQASGNPFANQQRKLSCKRKKGKYKRQLSNRMYSQSCSVQTQKFKVFDFINKRGKLTQIQPDKNLQFTIQNEDLKQYAQNKLIIYYQGLVNVIELNQEFKKISLKDLRLKESQKEYHLLQSLRQIQYIQKDKKVVIQDLKNTQFYHISTQKQLFKTFRLLNTDSNLSEWTFLLKWQEKDLSDKMKYYQKYACTEFNIFIYFKDHQFFEDVLKEFISYKIEKSLIDYYLLDDKKNLEQYCQLSQIPNLKKIELVLLYQKMHKIKPEFCKKVYNYMQQNSQRINIPDKVQNIIIDNIILSKDKKQNQADLSNALQELKNIYTRLRFIQPKLKKGEDDLRSYSLSQSGYGEDYSEDDDDCSYQNINKLQQEAPQQFNLQQRRVHLALSCDFNDEMEEFSQASMPKLTGSTNQYIEQRNKYKWSDSTLIENIWIGILDHINKNKTFCNFFDKNFIYSCFDIPDMLFFISIFDINYQNKTEIDKQEELLTISQQQNSVCVTKQIKEVKGTLKQSNVNILQRFFDPQDQTYYDEESDETFDKDVKNFERLKIYGSKLIVTNFSNKNYNLSLNYQVPQGAIPIQKLSHTKVQNLQINSFETKIISFYFYFPQYGSFTVFPAILYKEQQLMASAQIYKQLEVKPKEKQQDFQTVNDIMESGNINTILQFIEQKNVMNKKILNLNNFYWLLKKEDFYKQLRQILKEKGIYDNIIWSFSIYHKDLEGFKEFLQYRDNLNGFKQYQYLKCDYFEIKNFEITEYYPLITARCHQFIEGESAIRNIKFLETYQNFIEFLVEKQTIDQTDLMIFTNYLIAQNRYQDARNIFDQVDRQQIQCQLQYDYIDVYLKFILDFPDFSKVKEICETYIEYEFIEWKNLFIEILNQISEYEDKELIKNDLDQTQQKNTTIENEKKKEFECKLDNDKLVITLQQTDTITISFYQIEYEVLFSTDPFAQRQNLNQNYFKPYKIIKQKFEVDNDLFKQFEIKFEDIKNQNLIIQVQNEVNFKKNLLHIPCSMVVLVNQEDTLIRVFDPINQVPLSKVYIKTFTMNLSNQVQFYKDGYTDIRGSFNYGQLNISNLSNIKKFGILILSENFGSKVQYVESKKGEKKEFAKSLKVRGNFKGRKRMKKLKYQINLCIYYLNKLFKIQWIQTIIIVQLT